MNQFYDFKHKTYPHVGQFYLPVFTLSLWSLNALAHAPHQVCPAQREHSGIQGSEATVRVKRMGRPSAPGDKASEITVIKTPMPRVPNRCQHGQGENLRTASYLKRPGWRRRPDSCHQSSWGRGAARALGNGRKSGEDKSRQTEMARRGPLGQDEHCAHRSGFKL